jgi:hypothetical protein
MAVLRGTTSEARIMGLGLAVTLLTAILVIYFGGRIIGLQKELGEVKAFQAEQIATLDRKINSPSFEYRYGTKAFTSERTKDQLVSRTLQNPAGVKSDAVVRSIDLELRTSDVSIRNIQGSTAEDVRIQIKSSIPLDSISVDFPYHNSIIDYSFDRLDAMISIGDVFIDDEINIKAIQSPQNNGSLDSAAPLPPWVLYRAICRNCRSSAQ